MHHPSSTAAEIIRCARKLIVVGGYDSFSYSDIAKAVGIRNASIHHHFPTKADLVRTLVAEYRQEAAQGIATLERHVTSPVEQLRSYLAYWEACLADGSSPICVCALLATQIPVLPEEVALEVRAHFRALSAWLASVLERGAAQHLLTLQRPAREEAELILATVHGAMISARAYGDPETFGLVVRQISARLGF